MLGVVILNLTVDQIDRGMDLGKESWRILDGVSQHGGGGILVQAGNEYCTD